MKTFRKVIGAINRTFGAFAFGHGIVRMFAKDYEAASWALLIVSILFIIGYYAERWED